MRIILLIVAALYLTACQTPSQNAAFRAEMEKKEVQLNQEQIAAIKDVIENDLSSGFNLTRPEKFYYETIKGFQMSSGLIVSGTVQMKLRFALTYQPPRVFSGHLTQINGKWVMDYYRLQK